MVSGWGTSCTSKMTCVHTSRTQAKLDMSALVYVTPPVGWEEGTGESPRSFWKASLVYTAMNERPCFRQGRR